MSLQSPQSGIPDKASTVPSNTRVLASILIDIGAFDDFYQNFIDDEQDDDCLPSYKNPNRISEKYGLPPSLASAFVERSRITSSDPTSPLAASPTDDYSALLKLKLEIVCELGKGGFGKVYKCKDTTSKRFVAVKLVNDPKNAKETMREGQKLVSAKHKNIVQLHRVHDLSNGTCALEMELVEGGDLFQHLEAARRRPEQRLPGDTVLRLSRQMLETLVYLHDEKKLLHGDIKPQNMLMQCSPVPASGSTIDYSDAEIKLADFGLAKVMDQENSSASFMLSNASTTAGVVKGTLWYLSPKALQGASSGYERTYADDIWSACLVIYEMDTGMTLQQLMTAPGAIKLDELLTKTSRELLPLLASVLADPAASRCQSAAELLQKLDASADPLYIWEEYDAAASKYVALHPAASFVLEQAFSDNDHHAQLPLQPPLDLNFDIKALLSSATALGSATERKSGAKRAIRRLLKPSALTCSCDIPIWQQLVDGKEWLQCSPADCAKLEIATNNPSAAPDSKLYRRVVLQPGSIGSVQLPLAMKSEPYCEPAQAADMAILSQRVHESLPEFDITSMVHVSNPALASKYADYRHRLASHCNGNPNERILFHFASDFVIPKIWKEGEGHESRLSEWAEVGKGAYFAEHVMYPYAYKYKLWPSPPDYVVEPEPPIGASIQLFCTLVCLGNTADMGPGCETCPSPAWDAWKEEFKYQKRPDNPSPKPTRPPAMALPDDAAEKRNILDIKHVTDAPRYDSVMSTEGEFGTHHDSTNMNKKSGQRICDIMHPRLRVRAKEWAKQYVVFDPAASYPMFIATLTKTRNSPMGAQQLIDAGFDADCIKPFQPPPKTTPPPVPNRPRFLSLSSSSKPSSPAATVGESIEAVDPNATAAAKTWCETKGNYRSLGEELRKNRRPVSKEDDFRFLDKVTVAACVLCNKSFGFIVKKHHCYVCGKIVCDDCSKHTLKRCTECGDWQGVCTCAKPKYESLRMCKRCNSFGGMSSAANVMKEGFEQSRVAVDTAHRALSSFGIGIDPASLARAGCSLSDLQRAGFQTSVLHLKAAGLLAKDLKGLGFRAIDLIEEDSFDSGSLKNAGFSCSELVSASLDPQALKIAGFLMSDFVAAGCDCAYLKSCGFLASELTVAGFDTNALKNAGYDAAALKTCGHELKVLAAVGFNASELKLCGFDANDLKGAGFDAASLKAAAFGAASLKNAGFNAHTLKAAGYSLDSLQVAGFQILEMKDAGFSASEFNATATQANVLKDAGFSLASLIDAGYDLKSLRLAGFSVQDLIDNGKNDFHQLLDAGFENAALLAAGLVDPIAQQAAEAAAAKKAQEEAAAAKQKAAAAASSQAAAAARIAGEPDIFRAARDGDISLVGDHITADPSSVNQKDREYGWTAFMFSAAEGHLEVCKLLVSSKCDVISSGRNGSTALISSASGGHLEICELLVSSKCDVNSSGRNGWTALICSANKGHLEVCKLLVSSKCDVNSSNEDGNTALMRSASNGHLEICKLLVSSKCDVNSSGRNGETALYYSAFNGYLEVCKLLVSSKCDVNSSQEDGYTALIWSAGFGHLEICELLVSSKCDVNSSGHDGFTALMSSANKGHLEICKLLVSSKCDVNSSNKNGWTALISSASGGHLEVCKLLVSSKADLAARRSVGTALQNAMKRNKSEVVAFLRSIGAPQ